MGAISDCTRAFETATRKVIETERPDATGSSSEPPGHLKVTPIVVLGTFHSGTTILYRMLAMHPDATWFSQFSQRGGTVPGRRKLPLYAKVDRFSRRMSEHDWHKFHARTALDQLVARPTEGQSIWEYIVPRSGSEGRATSVSRLQRILEDEGRRSGKAFFVAKYPYLSRHIPVFREGYPWTKFVHIVRDGRVVAMSLMAARQKHEDRGYDVLDGKRISRHDTNDEHVFDGSVETGNSTKQEVDSTQLAHYWSHRVRMIHEQKDEVDLTEIRYEDFCEDVHGHLATFLARTGLDVDRFPFDRCPVTLTSTNKRWLEGASISELRTLETVLADELSRYFYI